ncbi:hypothetical protein Lal_00043140 [Lupinus albus]|nr:hypothetical protein Lal_00043140 [Lupinus albus]
MVCLRNLDYICVEMATMKPMDNEGPSHFELKREFWALYEVKAEVKKSKRKRRIQYLLCGDK